MNNNSAVEYHGPPHDSGRVRIAGFGIVKEEKPASSSCMTNNQGPVKHHFKDCNFANQGVSSF